jgi:RHS repeat-associated protein
VVTTRERDAWGNVLASTGTLAGPFGFVGGGGYQQDTDSGLMLLGARYYDPSVGRFISRDPTRYGGGDANLYRYCANNPANGTDPSGKLAIVDDLAVYFIIITVMMLVAYEAQPAIQQSNRELGNAIGDSISGTFDAVRRAAMDVMKESRKTHPREKRDGIERSKADREAWELEEPSGDDDDSPEPPGGSAGRTGYRQPYNIPENEPDIRDGYSGPPEGLRP